MSCCDKSSKCCDPKTDTININDTNTKESSDLKETVKEGYSKIAKQTKKENEYSLCGITGGCSADYSIFAEDYTKLEGYLENADLALGCGVPTSAVKINEGNVVLDLGCGAGNDCFIARSMVGNSGKVIGLDITPEMLKMAWKNTDKTGYNNVEFRFGDIEDMPVSDNVVDVVISNCVLNLVPNKLKAFQEIQRVLKPKGIFSISDIVITKELPEKMRKAAGMYVGCVSGAIIKDEYLKMAQNCGFNTSVIKEKEIKIPEKIMLEYLDEEALKKYVESGTKILSITVVGQKI